MIVAISGKIGAGKDTIGGIIQYLTWSQENQGDSTLSYDEFLKERFDQDALDWKVKKYAYKLKQIVSILTGCTVKDLENQEFKTKSLGECWTYRVSDDFYDIIESGEELESYEEEEKNALGIKPYTYRELLQRVGTNAMRERIHENVWVNALFADYKETTIIKVIGKSNTPSAKSNGIFIVDSVPYEELKYLMGKEIIGDTWETLLRSPKIVTPNWIITDLRFPNELKAIKERGGVTIRVNRPCEECGVLEGHKMIPHKKEPSNHPSETALDNAQFDYIIDNNNTIEELVEKVREILTKESII